MHINEAITRLNITRTQADFLDELDTNKDEQITNSVFEAAQLVKQTLENPQTDFSPFIRNLSQEVKGYFDKILEKFKSQFNEASSTAEETESLETEGKPCPPDTKVKNEPSYAKPETQEEQNVLNVMENMAVALVEAKMKDPTMRHEDFEFAGFPEGVEIINFAYKIDYSQTDNNTYKRTVYQDDRGKNIVRTEVVKGADTIQGVLVYTYNNKTFAILTDKIDARGSKLPADRSVQDDHYDNRPENMDGSTFDAMEKMASNR